MDQQKIRVSGKDKMQMFGNLSTMLKAGIPILEAVESLLEETKGNSQKVLETIREDLKAGRVLHESLSKFPESFDKITVSLIRAAEEAGTLETALRDVRDSLQKEMEFSDKVTSALMYPAFVMIVFVGVMITMLVVVMPKIAQVFTRLKMDLPLPTRIMIAASNAVMNHSIVVAAAAAIIIISIGLFYHFNRRLVANIVFSLPFLSGLMRQIDLTRFARSLSLLLGSGIPIVTALDLAEESVVKKDLQQQLINARKKLETGEKLSKGLQSERKLISGVVIKIIEVGEKTGSLHQSMQEVTEMLDYDVSKRLQKATAMLEPIMLVVVAIAVGSMMVSIIGPIYGLISSVSPT